VSKREKVSLYDLSRQERMLLTAVSEAMRKDGRSISVDIGKKRCYVNVHPWSEERTGHWETAEDEVQRGETDCYYRCSECGEHMYGRTRYCPECGARME